MNRLSKYFLLLIAFLFFQQCNPKTKNSATSTATSTETGIQEEQERAPYAIAIHGGAGVILKENLSDEQEAEYKAKLNEALDVGEKILKEGGTALDAVVETIKVMEDSPLFNAGKGAVFTNAGKNEMDASIMVGSNRNAGAVGGVTIVKNPITAAKAVLQRSPHVLLTGEGANIFARDQNLEIVDEDYFYTKRRWESLQRAKAKMIGSVLSEEEDFKFGTVGCVAMDAKGNLVAGTSTGGMTNKQYNRFGDVPIIGAGTYANNNTCAVSCTGHGEFFVRWVVAHNISAMMEYGGKDLKTASEAVIMDQLVKAKGQGGAICVDKYGNISMPFNSPGMYRGYAKPNEREVSIFK